MTKRCLGKAALFYCGTPGALHITIRLDPLLTKLGIQDSDVVLCSRMTWFRQVKRITGQIAEIRQLNLDAQRRPGWPKQSWDEVLENFRKSFVWVLLKAM